MDILVEKINVSDDKFLVTRLLVQNGNKVIKGSIIYTIESSKTSIDVEAPCDGYIFFNKYVEEMEEYPAGYCIAKIIDNNNDPFATNNSSEAPQKNDKEEFVTKTPDSIHDEVVFTPAALQLMHENNICAEKFDNSFVSKGDVLQLVNGGKTCYKSNDIVIIGGGGLGKMLIDTIRELRCYNIVGILDKDLSKGSYVYGYKVLGGDDMLPVLYEQGLRLAANSIGSMVASQKDKLFHLRSVIAEKIKKAGYIIPNIIHPAAIVESTAKLGDGNIVLAGAYIGGDVIIGDHCLINNHAIISHDCVLGNCVRVSPNATLAGGVRVGDNSLVGMNTTIYIGVSIGKDSILFNGVNVFCNVADNELVK